MMTDPEYARMLAGKLSETQVECLLRYPRGWFPETTLRALRTKGLIDAGERTRLGRKVRDILNEGKD